MQCAHMHAMPKQKARVLLQEYKQATIDAEKATKILHLLKILPLQEIKIIAQDLPIRTSTNTSQERLPERFVKNGWNYVYLYY